MGGLEKIAASPPKHLFFMSSIQQTLTCQLVTGALFLPFSAYLCRPDSQIPWFLTLLSF